MKFYGAHPATPPPPPLSRIIFHVQNKLSISSALETKAMINQYEIESYSIVANLPVVITTDKEVF